MFVRVPPLGRSWCRLWPSWKPFGPSRSHVGLSWGPLGGSWALLGRPSEPLGLALGIGKPKWWKRQNMLNT
eukprot:2405033-Pyramimonas_sp.AAC.1